MQRVSHAPASRHEIIGRALARMTSARDQQSRHYAIVRLIAELASEGTPWPEIDRTARDLGRWHGVDVDYVVPRVRIALLRMIERRLAGMCHAEGRSCEHHDLSDCSDNITQVCAVCGRHLEIGGAS